MQPHLKLITNAGRGYHVRCAYKSRDVAMKKKQKHHKILSSSIFPKAPQAYRSGEFEQVNRKAHGRSLGKSEFSYNGNDNDNDNKNDNEFELEATMESFYTENDSEDYGEDNITESNDADLHKEVPMPGCHMKIYNSQNKIATDVNIGDPLTLVVNIDKQHLYGLHVTDCIVRDGIGWGEQRLVGEDG